VAGKYSFKCDIGATKRFTVTWTDEDGARVDITGYNAKMQIRDRVGGNVLVELSVANGRLLIQEDEVDSDATGVVTIIIPADATDDILVTSVSAVYDLKLYSPDTTPVETRLIEGSVTWKPAVTTDT
jgi:hypothetical protein